MAKNIVKASLKELRMTPRKVDEVVSLVRGRTVEDALVILAHTPRRAAKPIMKLIESARANAINNHDLIEKGLLIETISVTSGPRLKRYKPVARGMAHPFQKRTSHVYVTLTGDKKPANPVTTRKRDGEGPAKAGKINKTKSSEKKRSASDVPHKTEGLVSGEEK